MGSARSGTDHRARLLASLVAQRSWALDDHRVDLLDEAGLIARELGDPHLALETEVARGASLLVTADTDREMRATLDRIRPELGHHERVMTAIVEHSLAMYRADIGEARRQLHALQHGLEHAPTAYAQWLESNYRIALATLEGRLADADRLNHEQKVVGLAAGFPDALVLSVDQDVAISRDLGRSRERLPAVDDLAESMGGLGEGSLAEGFVHAIRAVTFADDRDLDRAAEVIGHQHRQGFPLARAATVASLEVAYLFADAAATCELTEPAAVLYDLLLPHSGRIARSAVDFHGPVDRVLGRLAMVLGRYPAAAAHLRRAESTCAELGAPLAMARTWADLAALQLEHGPTAESESPRELLDAAQALAHERGAAGVERYVRCAVLR